MCIRDRLNTQASEETIRPTTMTVEAEREQLINQIRDSDITWPQVKEAYKEAEYKNLFSTGHCSYVLGRKRFQHS